MTNDGGVLLAVDYRATGEMHIGSGCMKIIEINKFLLGTMAGGATDCTLEESHTHNLSHVAYFTVVFTCTLPGECIWMCYICLFNLPFIARRRRIADKYGTQFFLQIRPSCSVRNTLCLVH